VTDAAPPEACPLVSVVMATYAGDDEGYLRQAVQSMLQQTYPHCEFLICVDGPVPPARRTLLEEFASNPHVRVIDLPENRGPAAARNAGLRAAQGEYIAIFDADDIAAPERLDRQYRYLRDHDLDVVGSFMYYIDARGKQTGRKDMAVGCASVRRSAHFINPVNNPTAFGKAAVFEQNLYDERFRKGEDYHLWARLMARGFRVGNVPEYLHSLRTGPDFFARRDHAFFDAELRSRLILMRTLPLWLQPAAAMTAISIPALRFLPRPALRAIYALRNRLRTIGTTDGPPAIGSASVPASRPEKARLIVVRSDSGMRDSRLQKELRMFVEAGFETTLLCWDRQQEAPRREVKDGYTVHRCRIRAPYGSKILFLMMPFWWIYEFAYLVTHRCDAIHACDFDTVVPALLAKRVKRVPVVYDIYDFYSVKSSTIPAVLSKFFRIAEQYCARRADAVVIVDPARAYLFGDRPPTRVEVAMNCPYDSVQPEWEKPESGPFTIFYGGAIAEYRGLEKLVEVTRDLENVRVVMAGWITHARYLALIEGAPQVEYLGMLPYAEALRRTYEAGVVYSYYDPVLEINRTANSSKMFDAFMCATPVLANAEPPAARVVAQHQCGALLPFDDDHGLCDTIIRWRDNRAEPRALGQNGRRLFEQELNWTAAASRILSIYHDLGRRT
jgi:glycosyltransferase involved in cell wall biosynthesis